MSRLEEIRRFYADVVRDRDLLIEEKEYHERRLAEIRREIAGKETAMDFISEDIKRLENDEGAD